jgi:two-component system sensor histidine kinase KdpD
VINRSRTASVSAYALAIILVSLCAAVLSRIPVITASAAAPVLLLAVLLTARAWGTGPALAGSACAALGFSLYFLPPAGLIIEDPNDWVAFSTFTVTAIVVGELAARAERRQLEAEEGRREIEQLYQQLGAAFDRASEAEAARRNEELKAALLDALTHNLRTPLTAIKASVTAIIGSGETPASSGLSKEGTRELLQVIDEESDRLNRFIEGLSAADHGDPTQRLGRNAASLAAIVRDALMRAHTATRHHRVQIAIDPTIPRLSVDPAAVTEVIYILLDNASKYSPAETTIRIEAVRNEDREVCISVADQGPGIPADLRERVFEKFYRIHGREPIDPRRTSVGLGLPIARRLVEAQAGRIWIGPALGGSGTTVMMTLPTSATAALSEPADASAAVPS